MAQHDYVIDNQTSANLRVDLNNALAAIVSQNSGATAPAATFANQFWYDTSTDQLKQRNEANTVWITLGTTDQTNNKFEPNQTFATQAEAQAGTNNTKAMTPLRTADAIAAQAGSLVLLGTLTTTSGSSQTISSLTLTPYKQLIFEWNGVSCGSGTITDLNIGAGSVMSGGGASDLMSGMVITSLVTGISSPTLSRSSTLPSGVSGSAKISQSGYSTATTSVSVSVTGGAAFDAGSIRVYGVR